MPKRLSRRSVTAIAALAIVMTGAPAPAEAAIPAAGQQWAALMKRSLTPSPDAVKLKSGLVTQRAAFATRVTELKKAQAVNAAAQTALITATTADLTAKTRLTAAQTALNNAKLAARKAPGKTAAATKAKAAVTAATKTVTTRKTEASKAATALKTAQTAANTATTGLAKAITTWQSASVAVRNTQQKIAALPAQSVYAAQATALGRDVVAQVRPSFNIADTTTVYGVTVHKIVAFPFQRMIDAAKADGIAISGGGFRTTQRQIELRTTNGCPDVWTAPASSCRVPTAIPGRSLHEIGLAVDISSGGKTINAKSPAFTWLQAHADEYGFINLPSEAWHWSITGG